MFAALAECLNLSLRLDLNTVRHFSWEPSIDQRSWPGHLPAQERSAGTALSSLLHSTHLRSVSVKRLSPHPTEDQNLRDATPNTAAV